MLKKILILALINLVTAVAAFFVERTMAPVDMPLVARGIIGISTAFFAYMLLETTITDYVRQRKVKVMVGTYLGFRLLRFSIAIIAMLILQRVLPTDFTFFFVNILVFYLVNLVYSTCAGVRGERKLSNNG